MDRALESKGITTQREINTEVKLKSNAMDKVIIEVDNTIKHQSR